MSEAHGTGSLLIGYLIALAALVSVLVVRRSELRGYLLAPLGAVVALVIAGMVGGTIVSVIEGRVGRHLPSLATVPLMLLCLAGAGAMAALWLTRRGSHPEALKRGTALVDAARLGGRESDGALRFGGIELPISDETKHFKIIGTTGTGKSTAIRELLGAALARGDRAVFADPDFGYLGRFYDPKRGDVILNPFDPRSARWDLYAELRAPYDYVQLARALIGDGTGSDKAWRGYAQTFFAALLRRTREAGICELGEFYRLLTSAPVEELRLLLEGTPAQPFLEAGNERMFASVRTVATASTAALDYIRVQTGEGLSLRAWVEQGKGVLFLPYRADQIAALRSVISTWMRIAIFQTMSQPEADHRLWFVIDEFDALGAIDGLKDALARLRKFGGRCVLGFQSIAQVSGLYGASEAQTIVENCGNTLILRCSASEGGGTALFASRLIGEREIVREKQTLAEGGGLIRSRRSSVSSTVEHVIEHAVMSSEIEQLPDLAGYLKLASRPQWLVVQFGRA